MKLYADPRLNIDIKDCYFYHTMELPNYGIVEGDWDLRHVIEDYLGGVNFYKKRVLEIGPASGYLTFEMEKRGAAVVSIDLEDNPAWDLVPYNEEVLNNYRLALKAAMMKLKNSYWLSHELFNSSAKVHYGSAYSIPKELGKFDVAIMTAVLLHTRNPLQIVDQCANFADCIVITDSHRPELEGSPVMRLIPAADNSEWAAGAWWYFSSDFFRQYLGVHGFTQFEKLINVPTHKGQAGEQFTLVARRSRI